MSVRSIRLTMILLCGGLFWLCSGCGGQAWPNDVELAGTWQLNTEGTDERVTTTLNFDDGGCLTEFAIMVGEVEVTHQSFHTDVSITGNNVVIELEFSGNTLKFEGTFDPDSQIVEGELSVQIDAPLVKITISGITATMTKQEDALAQDF